MPPLMQLPRYELQNTQLDTEPVTNALMQNRVFGLQQERVGMDRERLGMERERLDMQKAESVEQANLRKVQRWGSVARVIDEMPDTPQKQAMAQRVWASNPELSAHLDRSGIDRNHPGVWKFLMAEAGKYDPLGEKLKLAELAKTQAQTGLAHAQAANVNRREDPEIVRTLEAAGYRRGTPEFQDALRQTIKGQSPLDQARADVLRQIFPGLAPASAQAQPDARLIPQSYEGNADPNMIPVQTPQPSQGAPQRQPGTLDNLTPQQRVGVGMAIAGMGDAGKIIAESSAGFGKEGQNEIDKAIVARAMDVNDLNHIAAQFKPEYLGLEGRAKAFGLDWKDFLTSGKLAPGEKQYLSGYTQFATATTERFNNRIKALSGTAVSGAEERRMFAANPNVSDGPTGFESKLKQQLDMQRMAVARYNWLRREYRGTPEDIAKLAQSGKIESLATLDDMKKIYDQRSQQLRQELRAQNPNAAPEQIEKARRARLKGEFGI